MTGATRVRARQLGDLGWQVPSGRHGAITDVPGVRVGHATVVRPGVRTGVTAVVPPGDDLRRAPVRAGFFAGNGYGKVVGTTQLLELGELETPILLTGTLSTFRVADALVEWVLERPGNEEVRSVNPVVAETNDGHWRTEGHRGEVGRDEVRTALDVASDGPVAEGNVGAGTGTVAFGFKAGIGTSSRVVDLDGGPATVGVLAQPNHGGRLRVAGREIDSPTPPDPDGSVVLLVATDAPLDPRQLNRLARRAVYALARTGAGFHGGSGDYAITFSTVAASSAARIDDGELDPVWEAGLEAVDEAVLNGLTMAEPVARADGATVPALDLDQVRGILSDS